MNINLDDAVMPAADFTASNLSGANMSEGHFKGCKFSGAALYNTCFYDSDISNCDFKSASFGATDIAGATLNGAQFSTLSAFTLDFSRTRTMRGCNFINPDGQICRMSRPPIVIRGLGRDPIIMMDDKTKYGQNIIDPRTPQTAGGKIICENITQSPRIVKTAIAYVPQLCLNNEHSFYQRDLIFK